MVAEDSPICMNVIQS
jgi:CheY-like chemotaxis protein